MQKSIIHSVVTAALICSPLLSMANERIDRQTETAIPRDGNLYGLGIGVLPKASGSDELKTMVLPIVKASYADKVYINALQAGIWLLDSDDKRLRLGLAAEARFGWDAKDGDRTKGMDDRDFSVDVGPALRWQTDFGTVNAQWNFDAGSASKGQNVQLQYIKGLIRGPGLRLNGLVGATWNDDKVNDYYYGVANKESTPFRPAYKAGAGMQYQIGFNGAYPVNDKSYLLFGTFLTYLGDEQADSPIVETRTQPLAYAGYTWSF